MIILPDKNIVRTKIIPPVPNKEWRTPSAAQPKDQFGNENRKFFRVRAKTHDGVIKWCGIFYDRYDWDAFVWAIATGSLPHEPPLWHLPTPMWPGLDSDYLYDFATVWLYGSPLETDTSVARPSDWNAYSNTMYALGAGGGGAQAYQAGGGGAFALSYNRPMVSTFEYYIGRGGWQWGYQAGGDVTWGGNGSGSGIFFGADQVNWTPWDSANVVWADNGEGGGTCAPGHASSCVGDQRQNGGWGQGTAYYGGGGGGGAAGPRGDGGNANVGQWQAGGNGGPGDGGYGAGGGGGATWAGMNGQQGHQDANTFAAGTGCGGGGGGGWGQGVNSGSVTAGGWAGWYGGGGGAGGLAYDIYNTPYYGGGGGGGGGLVGITWTPTLMKFFPITTLGGG